MSVLNLALPNCALAREVMGEYFEKNMKRCNSMASVWKMAKELDTTELVAIEAFGPHVHVAAIFVANASSSRVDIATTSTEAILSGALPIFNGVHRVTLNPKVRKATFHWMKAAGLTITTMSPNLPTRT